MLPRLRRSHNSDSRAAPLSKLRLSARRWRTHVLLLLSVLVLLLVLRLVLVLVLRLVLVLVLRLVLVLVLQLVLFYCSCFFLLSEQPSDELSCNLRGRSCWFQVQSLKAELRS